MQKPYFSELFKFYFLIISLTFCSSLLIAQSQIYITPGTYTWTVPPCVTQVTVEAWGGGGGGGAVWSRFNPTHNNSPSAEACVSAGGGGGGGYARRTYTVVPGQTYTIVVGAGGAGGTVNSSGDYRANNGSPGGNSTFSGPATVAPGTLTGFGGSGGFAANFLRSNCNGGCWINHEGVNGNGGSGGSGANGTAIYNGGNGAAGVHSGSTNDRSGGGGGGAGTSANGGNATGTTTGGTGGNASGGNGANGIVQPYGTGYLGTNGNNGNTLGGGGGGACGHNRQASSSTHRSNIGGNGARGEVRISYVLPAMPEPTFSQVAPICSGGNLSALPSTSLNGYAGTWSPAINNTATTTYIFTPDPSGPCADTASMTIVVNPATVPTFASVGPICSGSALSPLPTSSQNGVSGTWSPTLDNTATTLYTFTPSAGQCATNSSMTITVNSIPLINNQPQNTAICANGSTSLSVGATAGPYQWQYFDGSNWLSVSNGAPNGFSYSGNNSNTLNVTTSGAICGPAAEYRVIVGNTGCDVISQTATVTVIRASRIAPTGPQCSGTQLNFEACSQNASFNWVVSPQIGTTADPLIGSGSNFSFVPTNTIGSNVTFPITVTMNYLGVECIQNFNPTIVSPPDAGTDGTLTICDGSAPSNVQLFNALGGTPDQGGTWTNNGNIYTYTVTGSAPCSSVSANVTVISDQTIPTFDPVDPICVGEVLAPLPSVSLDGISGTWSPAINNQQTTTYLFTPGPGECATTANITIEVNPPSIVPDFEDVSPICSGEFLEPLPNTSLNGVVGSWSPSLNNTQTTTYIFTPNPGECAADASIMITVDQPTVPQFDQVGPYCAGDLIDPLPTISIDGINGSWSPSVNNTSTTTYAFTPISGQCASVTTMIINVGPQISPTFDPIPAVCSGSTINPLPLSSIEGVVGAWSPSFNNLVTTEYTFTPNAGQCAQSSLLTVEVDELILPQFSPVDPICSGESLAALPTTSNNGVNGFWTPALDNTQTTTYAFLPTIGQCSSSVELTIVVNSPTSVPVFQPIDDLCLNEFPPVLPTVSDNGISGTWSDIVSTAVAGTQSYSFIPDPGECSVPATIEITVINPVTPLFDPFSDLCQSEVAPVLNLVSNNGISGSWSGEILTSTAGTQILTFTPSIGICAESVDAEVVVHPLPNINAGSDIELCEGEMVALSAQGAITYNWDNGVLDGVSFTPQVGTTVFTVIATDANGCSGSDQTTVIVNPLPVVSAGSDQTICEGTSVSLSGSGAMNYSWDNNIADNISFSAPVGTIVYTVTGTDINGCTGTDQVSISVNPSPSPTFTFEGQGCSPLEVDLINTTPNAQSCEWSISNGDEITGCSGVSILLTQAGCYDVSLTTSVNGCIATFTAYDLICAEAAPIADFSYNPQIVSTLDPVVEFENQSIGANSYLWNFGDNSPQSQLADPIHEFQTVNSGTYEVMLVAYSQTGCSDTAYAFVNVEEELIFYVPNAFTPDGDLYNQTFKPVFTSGFDPYDFHLLIFNRWGEIVFESYNHEIGWDGSYGGVNGDHVNVCQDGVYTWKIELKIRTNDERKVVVGHVNLIR